MFNKIEMLKTNYIDNIGQVLVKCQKHGCKQHVLCHTFSGNYNDFRCPEHISDFTMNYKIQIKYKTPIKNGDYTICSGCRAYFKCMRDIPKDHAISCPKCLSKTKPITCNVILQECLVICQNVKCTKGICTFYVTSYTGSYSDLRCPHCEGNDIHHNPVPSKGYTKCTFCDALFQCMKPYNGKTPKCPKCRSPTTGKCSCCKELIAITFGISPYNEYYYDAPIPDWLCNPCLDKAIEEI